MIEPVLILSAASGLLAVYALGMAWWHGAMIDAGRSDHGFPGRDRG